MNTLETKSQDLETKTVELDRAREQIAAVSNTNGGKVDKIQSDLSQVNSFKIIIN